MQISYKIHRPLEVEFVLPVRSYDTDFVGIVNNTVYVRWLEDLRLKLLDEHLPLKQQIEQGYAPVLSETQIEYKRPVKLLDQVIGRLWVSKLGRRKWTVQAEIIVNNKVAAVATQMGAFVSLQNGRPIPMPEELLKKYLEDRQDK